MNNRNLSILYRLPRQLNVREIDPCDRTNFSITDFRGYEAYAFNFTWRGCAKATIQGIKAHLRQGLSNCQFLFWEIVDSRRLLTVTERGFKKLDDAWFRRHRKITPFAMQDALRALTL